MGPDDMQSKPDLTTPEQRRQRVKEKVEFVLSRMNKCELSPIQVSKLSGYRLLERRRRRHNKEGCNSAMSVAAGIVSVTVAILVYYQLFTHEGFSRFWLKWLNLDLYAEQCTMVMPNFVHDMFRPPVDCSMCDTVSQVDRVENMDPGTFEMRYAYSGRPVVVMDGARNWSAIDNFSLQFFKEIYGEESPVLNHGKNCQFFPYQTEFQELQEVFNMTEDRQRKPWYIGWSNCDSSAANILRQYYSQPYFLPKEAEASKTDWIFMGSPGYGAHMHIDRVGNPSWQAQIVGTKRWFLEPPPECYMSCTGLNVTVYPGEIIVLDTDRWFHSTLIVSEEMSITIGSEFD